MPLQWNKNRVCCSEMRFKVYCHTKAAAEAETFEIAHARCRSQRAPRPRNACQDTSLSEALNKITSYVPTKQHPTVYNLNLALELRTSKTGIKQRLLLIRSALYGVIEAGLAVERGIAPSCGRAWRN